jgi:hypothetical protein
VRNLKNIILLFCLAGCSSTNNELLVELKTDFIPSVEFHSVRTTVTDADQQPLLSIDSDADPTKDYFAGSRVGEFEKLTSTDVSIIVSLLNDAGDVIAERPTRLVLNGRQALTVVITRDCQEVQCPSSEQTPNLEACVAGTCVDPKCHPGAPQYCGLQATKCNADTDCTSEFACVEPRCVEHACFAKANDTLCEELQMCVPEFGCKAPDRCLDGVQNGPETSVDCGGDCPCGNQGWAKAFGDEAFQTATAIGTDDANNLYLAGYFLGELTFGGDTLTTSVVNAYVASFNSQGQHRWSKHFAGGNTLCHSLAVDPSGTIIVVGEFEDYLDLGEDYFDSNGFSSGFAVSLDADGNHLWSRQLGNDASHTRVIGTATDGQGNMVLTGQFTGSVDFGSGSEIGSNAGSPDVFVASYVVSTGEHRWSNVYGGDTADNVLAIVAAADGMHFITGQFTDTLSFGGAPLSAVGGSDLFVAAYDANGAHAWSISAGTPELDEGARLALGDDDRLFVGGWSHSTIDLGLGPLDSEGSFVMALTASTGEAQWSQRIGGLLSHYPHGMIAAGNELYVLGDFADTIEFGDSVHTSHGSQDIFIVAYNSQSGLPTASRSYGGLGVDRGWDLALGDQGSIYITGNFDSTINVTSPPLTTAGEFDIFLANVEFP